MPDSRITFTPNLKLTKLPANHHVWAQIMNDNLTMVDAAVTGFIVFNNLRGSWTNSTAYALGDTVVDPDTAVIWQAQVAHTSMSIPHTFFEERTANPTFWTVYSSAAVARGAWTGPGTTYVVNDFVVNGLQYAVCIVAHVSSNSFAHDVSLGYWSVLIDLSSVGTALLPPVTGALDANKFAMTNTLGTAYGIFDKDYALNVMNATSIGIAVLRATSPTAGRLAIDAAQSTDTTTQPTIDNSTKYASTAFVKSAIGASASLTVSDTAPVSPGTNAMWWNSVLGTMFIYYNDGNSTQWVPANPTPQIPGSVIQTVSFETGTVATGTTVIPYDDTIPQQTEGDQYMTLAITPQSATSRLIINVKLMGSASAACAATGALFQDATANALAVWVDYATTATTPMNFSFTHVMTSGTTSATTFKVRAGVQSGGGTFTFNGSSGARLMGGVMASSIVIQEVM